MRNKQSFLYLLFLLLTVTVANAQKKKAQVNNTPAIGTVWTVEKANAWYSQHKWITGANYIPANAINQLEMWQADTWDPKAIDRELGWAEDLGFTSLRVFLHDLLWQQDPKGFLKRMDQFLALAHKHHLGVMFVLLDSVWDPHPQLGPQRARVRICTIPAGYNRRAWPSWATRRVTTN